MSEEDEVLLNEKGKKKQERKTSNVKKKTD